MGIRPEELSKFFDRDRGRFGIEVKTVDGEIIVNKLDKFIVLGKPGAGKTTYLKFLTLSMLDSDSQIERRRLPIFVTLREWADEKIPLIDFITGQFDICGFSEAQLFVEKMLGEGKCLVLFDGLDEVSQEVNQDDIIRQIRNFTDKYAANQFIISCRVAAYNHWFERFTDVEMADFNEVQMEAFIRNWFHDESKVAEECWGRLKNNSPLRELASVPLLLTLLCLEYSESNDFPPNRAELYERAIETLLTKWDSSRRIRRAEVYKQLGIKRKESMFAHIAFGTFSENEYFIREQMLAKMIEKYIQHLPGFNPADLEPNSRDILKAIEAHHGIFIERAKGIYSFAHLTFQEYFTAKYIVDNQWKRAETSDRLDEKKEIILLENVLENHLYDPKWKEVFLLVAGMLDNADELLLMMRKKANRVLEVPEIDALFRISQRGLLSKIYEFPEVVQQNSIVIIAHAFARSLSGASNNIFSRALSLSVALNHSLDRSIYYEIDAVTNVLLDHFISNTIVHSLIRVFEGNVQTSNRSFQTEQVISKFENYLFANLLIMDCLNSGCYVSKPIREKLIHEMFLPKH